jgi:hypothetical protein
MSTKTTRTSILRASSIAADRRLTIAAVHPGHRAALEASKAGLPRRQQQQAYNSAMVAFQDHYHQEVAQGTA